MKRLIRLILAVVVVFFLVKLCTDNLGSVINLPGGLGGNSSSSTEDNGGWFSPKQKTENNSDKEVPKDISDLERELGIGNESSPSTTINTPSTTSSTTTSTNPLSFKGIPITGSLTTFGNSLVNAGFKKSLDGTYTGDFAGYSGCKVTPVGNPVQEVRVDFPVISDWNNLEKAYDSLQASLTQKYGMDPKTSQGSNVATYSLPNGTITLDADVKNQSSWHVILKYSNASSVITIPGTSGKNPIDDL